MVTRGSPKPLLRVRVLLPLPPRNSDIDTMSEFLFLHFLQFALQFTKKISLLSTIGGLILQVCMSAVQIKNLLALMRSIKKAVRLFEAAIPPEFCTPFGAKKGKAHRVLQYNLNTVYAFALERFGAVMQIGFMQEKGRRNRKGRRIWMAILKAMFKVFCKRSN